MVVATVTDDVRLFDVPKLRVVALRFTETARARITKVIGLLRLPHVAANSSYRTAGQCLREESSFSSTGADGRRVRSSGCGREGGSSAWSGGCELCALPCSSKLKHSGVLCTGDGKGWSSSVGD